MRIQILDYQVGPHTFRMVKPSDFNIFKALPSLIPFITTIDTTQKVIFETEIDDDETATKLTPCIHHPTEKREKLLDGVQR